MKEKTDPIGVAAAAQCVRDRDEMIVVDPDEVLASNAGRNATSRPPARFALSPLGTLTRFETTISRAKIGPPSCATAALP